MSGKRAREEEGSELGEPTYAVKKRSKLAIPPRFPDPHTYMETPRHGWEEDLETASSDIRAKPNWHKKVFNSDIISKWESEIKLDERDFLWPRLLSELQYLATLVQPDAEPSPVDGVWHKDNVIPQPLHDKLVKQVEEHLETQAKDFHPYSNDTVVDLVHPALYCYVHGQSRWNEDPYHSQLRDETQWKAFLGSGQAAQNDTLKQSLEVIEKAREMGNTEESEESNGEEEEEEEEEEGEEEEEPEPEPENEEDPSKPEQAPENAESLSEGISYDPSLLFHPHVPVNIYFESKNTEYNEPKRLLANHLASHFRWLPADVSVDMYGKVHFDSYINGLHPFEHRELYDTIAEVMEHFLPLWGHVLRDLTVDPAPHATNRLDLSQRDEHRVAEGITVEELVEEYTEMRHRLGLASDDEDGPFSDGDDETERERKDRVCERLKKEVTENGGVVDILNKLGDITLAPPVDLTRSSLKVIVKIASIELTPEKPSYQGSWHLEGVPEEGIISTGIYYFAEENIRDNRLNFRVAVANPENSYIQNPMGMASGDMMCRTLGSVQTKQGRALAFPNTMQHCVAGVHLADDSKPGYRKMLVFFLVDPNKNADVLSTGQVPPPCKAWYDKLEDVNVDESTLQTLEEARENREKLMFTRKFYVVSQNENLFERECTFCEH